MTFDEILEQIISTLQRDGRVSYRALKRKFGLDDSYIEDLKTEIIQAKRLAVDEDGTVLVWTGPGDRGVVAESQTPAILAAGERRQLTVMFCDLVGSTALSEQLDPEEWRDLMQTYREICAAVVERLEGYVAQYLGDGLLVYFGYPSAHDDDAQRAVRAGLEIIRQLNAVSVGGPKMALAARIGIHTGMAVVGNVSGHRRLPADDVVSATSNLAARIQQVAHAGAVLISDATRRLVAGFFSLSDLGPQTLKGISVPARLYQVLRETDARSRLEIAGGAGLTPFTGREEELNLLVRQWQRAKAGRAQIVAISGEAGIGKSRLAQELKRQVRDDGGLLQEFYCSSYHRNSAFYPVISYFQQTLGFQREDSSIERWSRLEQAVRQHGRSDSNTMPLLADLLSIRAPDSAAESMNSLNRRQKTEHALAAWLNRESEDAPVFSVWEDLHWADPSSIELLSLILEQVATRRILVLLTFRPEFAPSWRFLPDITEIALQRLGTDDAITMVARVSGGTVLPRDIVDRVTDKSDGVPLYIEELTKSLLESIEYSAAGDRGLAGSSPSPVVPPTLKDSLTARLDRLGPAKEIAQLGAVLGREFSYELLQAVSMLGDADLQNALGRLTGAGVIHARGLPTNAQYRFKHALLQDAAYESLLKTNRRQYHQTVAAVLEQQPAETPHPELLAHHYTEAGDMERAIPYWQHAGESAARRSANLEAANFLNTALRLQHATPNTPQRAQQELEIRLVLGPVMVALKGYGADDVLQIYTRVVELCGQLGETPQLFAALYGLWSFYGARADYKRVCELARQLLNLAGRQQDEACLIIGHWTLGCSLFYTSEFQDARTHFQQALALHDFRLHDSLAPEYGYDPAAACLSFSALTLWLTGFPESALRTSERAVEHARSLAHPFSLGFALAFAAWLHHYRRDADAVLHVTEELLSLSQEQIFPYWEMIAKILRGWALAERMEIQAGISQVREGLDNWRAIGAETNRPFYLALLALACAKGADTDEASSAITQAFECSQRTGEEFHKAELCRIRAELILNSSNSHESLSEAEQYLSTALAIARQQKAKSLELRAAIALGRLSLSLGRPAEAYKLVAEAYQWFAEGFDSLDLREGKQLMENCQYNN